MQESYLAVPYAFSKLNAGAQAADYYESALQSFGDESVNLDTAIAQIHEGHMLDDLLGEDKDARYGWFWQLKTLPDSPQSRYLYTLLADNDFQDGLKNYRDLAYLTRTLSHWDDSMDAFARHDRYAAARLCRASAAHRCAAGERRADAVAQRARRVGAQLDAIETGNDVAALGTATERAQWAPIARLEEQLEQLPPGLEREEARDKLRLIKGVLYWRLDANFKARAYQEQRQLREIDAALEELQNRWVRVQQARATVPTNTGEFAARIAALAARIKPCAIVWRIPRSSRASTWTMWPNPNCARSRSGWTPTRCRRASQLADIYDRSADQGGKSGNAPPADGAAACSRACSRDQVMRAHGATAGHGSCAALRRRAAGHGAAPAQESTAARRPRSAI